MKTNGKDRQEGDLELWNRNQGVAQGLLNQEDPSYAGDHGKEHAGCKHRQTRAHFATAYPMEGINNNPNSKEVPHTQLCAQNHIYAAPLLLFKWQPSQTLFQP